MAPTGVDVEFRGLGREFMTLVGERPAGDGSLRRGRPHSLLTLTPVATAGVAAPLGCGDAALGNSECIRNCLWRGSRPVVGARVATSSFLGDDSHRERKGGCFTRSDTVASCEEFQPPINRTSPACRGQIPAPTIPTHTLARSGDSLRCFVLTEFLGILCVDPFHAIGPFHDCLRENMMRTFQLHTVLASGLLLVTGCGSQPASAPTATAPVVTTPAVTTPVALHAPEKVVV